MQFLHRILAYRVGLFTLGEAIGFCAVAFLLALPYIAATLKY